MGRLAAPPAAHNYLRLSLSSKLACSLLPLPFCSFGLSFGPSTNPRFDCEGCPPVPPRALPAPAHSCRQRQAREAGKACHHLHTHTASLHTPHPTRFFPLLFRPHPISRLFLPPALLVAPSPLPHPPHSHVPPAWRSFFPQPAAPPALHTRCGAQARSARRGCYSTSGHELRHCMMIDDDACMLVKRPLQHTLVLGLSFISAAP